MRVRALVAIWCRQHPNPNAAQDLRSEFVRAARHDQSEPAIARPGSQDLILLPVGALIDESIEATDMPVVGVLLIEEAQRRNRGGSIVTMESRFDASASGRLP